MAVNFGAQTDHWGLALGTVIESSKTPVSQSRADALDENGDIADSAWHGNTEGDLYEASVTYQIDTTELDLSELNLGNIEAGKAATGVEVTTSNSEWPKVTITGTLGTEPLEQAKTYALPEVTVLPLKKAQAMGVTVTTGKLASCTLSASCDLATAHDGAGEPVAHGVSGAICSASAEAVATSTAAPVLAAAATWTISTGSGTNEPQADWHTASIAVEKKLAVTIAQGGGGGE